MPPIKISITLIKNIIIGIDNKTTSNLEVKIVLLLKGLVRRVLIVPLENSSLTMEPAIIIT